MSRTRWSCGAALLVAWVAAAVLLQPEPEPNRHLAAAEGPVVPVRGVTLPPTRTAAARTVPAHSPSRPAIPRNSLVYQSQALADAKSHSCTGCHKTVGDPHANGALSLGCTDCHGGDATALEKERAHVTPRHPGAWTSSANPIRNYTLLNHERHEFIRFVNPGDLRIAHLSCGTVGCHPRETLEVKKSMMTHGCMLWGAAAYNNGAVAEKWPRYGESYSMYGTPQRLQTVPAPTPEETARKGVLPFLDPLPRFPITQPGNILRIFERGGRFRTEVGIPERLEEVGRPRERLSNRGLGTLNRTDPVFIGLAKTRLLDPTLNFMGTNEQAGDYRSSGCTACHVVYANDRSEIHSGPFARYGNTGRAAARKDDFVRSVDPTIPKNESGHPIAHRFTRAIPTSQCIICHIHPGTTVMNSFLGYMWWDQESDGELIYTDSGRKRTAEEFLQSQLANPNLAAVRRYKPDPSDLAGVTRLNDQLQHSQFADFHGHGWLFRAVYRRDTRGQLIDHRGEEVSEPTTAKLKAAVEFPKKVRELYRHRSWTNDDRRRFEQAREDLERVRDNLPVHLMDVHLERGMHCVDCHFLQDVHGNTKLYGEVRAAIEITCQDCHGTVDRHAMQMRGRVTEVRTSGPAATERASGLNGRNLMNMRTPYGRRRFERQGQRLIQHSMVEKGLSWEVTQVADTIDPGHTNYNALSALAKTIRFDAGDNVAWGNVPTGKNRCAHNSKVMTCAACHSSWNPSCFGCHLSQRANQKMPSLHNEGDISRNYVSYNFQTLRDDVYMLARDGNVTGNRVSPARSACAIHVGSYNQNRESIYFQQQTISADGHSGISFSTNVPHTVRGRDGTRQCNDCHLSRKHDNNARMAQLLMQGTNYMNFIGRYCWVAAGEHGLHAAVVTERDEPQAVIGSHLHEMAFPKQFARHVAHDREMHTEFEHPGLDVLEELLDPFKRRQTEILQVQLRGEYVYAACGRDGLRIFDAAFTDHKGFSERITTAPVSPLGQKFYVKTPYATGVASPATTAPDPTREGRLPENDEEPIHPMYGYIYVSDLHEGLILVGAGTLLDGNPVNNFIKPALAFNPDGVLDGARSITIAGTHAYICCTAGLVVISLDNPLEPRITAVLGNDELDHPHTVQVQFRYAFVCDAGGLKVLDVTDLSHPQFVAELETPAAHNLYIARTYAYLAAGEDGLVIVDVRNPLEPRVDQVYTAGGQINDLHDVKLGITYNSLFAYLADGHNGLRIVELTSPRTPGNNGFSPRPVPRLIATLPLPKGGHALSISEGLDRDRAVDEAGNQLSVFGRVGARPLNLDEQQRLYRRNGHLWGVHDIRRDSSVRNRREREAKLLQTLRGAYSGYSTP